MVILKPCLQGYEADSVPSFFLLEGATEYILISQMISYQILENNLFQEN